MTTFLTIAFFAGLYFLPTIVAWNRRNHAAAIFALNLFLGWTLIGWVVALVMALWQNNSKPTLAPSGEKNWQRDIRQTRADLARLGAATRRTLRHEKSPAQP